MSEEFIDDIIASAPAEGTAPEVQELEKQAEAEVDATTNTTPTTEVEPVPEQAATIVKPAPVDKSPDAAAPVAVDADPAVEALAKQLGWSSDHTGDTYVDASTYILRSRDIQSSMRDHNRELKTQLMDMKSSIDALQSHNELVYKSELSRLETELAGLTKQKDAAIEVGDVAEVKNLDQQIDTVKETIKTPVPTPAPSSNPEYDTWLADNQWYVTDQDMASYADQVAQQYTGAPADRIYKAVRNKVAELWPEKFESVKPEAAPTLVAVATPEAVKPVMAPNPVEGGHVQAAPTTFTQADLTPSQQSMMNQFEKLGIMTKDQYISDIAKLQGDN